MPNGFSFDRALTYPFKAPHFGSFPWVYGLSYAGVFMVLIVSISLLSWRDVMGWVQTINSLEAIDTLLEGTGRPPSPGEVFGVMMVLIVNAMSALYVWVGAAVLGSWMIWSVFEVASQRRYIWGSAFSLGFGADELRMMVVGLLWGVMSFVTIVLPMLAIFGGSFAVIMSSAFLEDPDAALPGIFFAILGVLGLMLLLTPLYIFLATRLSPSFGMTVKEERIVFFDAWTVSRGRFWPILGAYVIILIVVTFISQIVSALAQLVMMPLMMTLPSGGEVTGDEVAAIFLSPAFLIPMAVIYFILLFVQGLTQHFVGAPAALAARHDPRNDLGEAERVDIFS